jgi:hypothetical protein
MKHSLVILANSRKKGNRCIAGVDSQTGEWLRPCYGTGEDGIPWQVRRVGGAEPGLLDIIQIPLDEDGPHQEIQPENRFLGKGEWRKLGTASVDQVAKHCQKSGLIFHNTDRWIHGFKLQDVPESKRHSLCLIQAHVAFSTEASYRGKRVVARFGHDQRQYCIPVTDLEFERRIPAYGTGEADCLLTASLGLPFQGCCYKFIAGVVLLSDLVQ